jgi:tetratricopeptide (TPR) repeat protein
MRERGLGVAVLAFALAMSATARAADPPPTPEQEALFRAGMAEYEKGNRTSAIATWENLLGTLGENRGYKILYNLGVAYQASGDVTHAIERYRAFLTQVRQRDNVGKDLEQRANDASKRLAQLESTYGAVEVRAPQSGPVVLTRVGTGDPRPAGYVVWLAPGVHTIEINVGTQKLERKEITIEAGHTLTVETSPPPAETPPPPPPVVTTAPPPKPAEPSGLPPLVWVGAGITIASVSLPIVSFFVADKKKDDALALSRTSAEYRSAKDTYDSWRTLHYVSYAVPVVLAGLTIAYAIVARPSRNVTVGLAGSQLRVEGRF